MKIYIASPFFNEEQLERVKHIEGMLRMYDFDYFSPRTDTYVKPDSNAIEKQAAFNENVKAIENAYAVIAVTDGKDVGTMFEAGYAYAKDVPIIYFAETLGDKPFNLMLAQSGNAVCKSKGALTSLLSKLSHDNIQEITSKFEGEIE